MGCVKRQSTRNQGLNNAHTPKPPPRKFLLHTQAPTPPQRGGKGAQLSLEKPKSRKAFVPFMTRKRIVQPRESHQP